MLQYQYFDFVLFRNFLFYLRAVCIDFKEEVVCFFCFVSEAMLCFVHNTVNL